MFELGWAGQTSGIEPASFAAGVVALTHGPDIASMFAVVRGLEDRILPPGAVSKAIGCTALGSAPQLRPRTAARH